MKPQLKKQTQDSVPHILPAWSPSGNRLSHIRWTEPDPFIEQDDAGHLSILSGENRRNTGELCLFNYRERGKEGEEIKPVWLGETVLYHHPLQGYGWELRRIDGETGSREPVALPEGGRALTLWTAPGGDRVAAWVRIPADGKGRKRQEGIQIIQGTDLFSAEKGENKSVPHYISLEGWELLRARWSPDGGKIGVLLQKAGGRPAPAGSGGLFRRFFSRSADRGAGEEPMRYLGIVDLSHRTLDLIEEHPGLGMLSWSPSGDRVVYHILEETGVSSIRILDLHGKASRVISHGPEGGTDPLWAPSGDWILFQIRLKEARHLGMVRHDGTEEVRLTRAGWALYPAWSPTGEGILFLRTIPTMGPFYGWKTRLAMIDLKIRKEIRITPEEVLCFVDTCCPVWSPDGKSIAFSARDEAVAGGKLSIWTAELGE